MRGGAAMRRLARASPARSLSSKAAEPLVLARTCNRTGVLTLTFNQERKLNAWTTPLLKETMAAMDQAAASDAVKGVVITGKGRYYSAGVDLSSIIQVMRPSSLVQQIRDSNQLIFEKFIQFPKPLVAAVNGPAVGAAVTTATLTDAIVALEAASFNLPFAKLGVPPEGCSSVTFAEMMGEKNAERMLGPEAWVPTASEAREIGLISEVVPGEDAEVLVERAIAVCAERIASGGGRRFDAAEALRLRRINAEESAQLANAFVSPQFLGAMYDFNVKRKKPQLASFFYVAKALLPLWQPAPIKPNVIE
ncbi:hypothetical protein AB1Y20_010659 [Prymnesium parvum]|uniref:3-hydroxyisobutyryl-CoA hydrolase n=1 Tax=Prymnesium parvum TaxID=97485 RepID=A0AB34ITF9_PRYPA